MVFKEYGKYVECVCVVFIDCVGGEGNLWECFGLEFSGFYVKEVLKFLIVIIR